MIQEAFPVATTSPAALVVHDDNDNFLKSSDAFNRIKDAARMLAYSGFTPKHLVVPNDPERSVANCFRVVANADRWGLDMFSVADQTYSIGGKLAYQGQLVIAIINRHAGLDGKLGFKFDGKVGTDELTVTVSGKFKGAAEPSTLTLSVGQAKTDNKMWKQDPEQKLCYTGATRWARRYCPEVILGVMTFEDLEVIAANEVPELPVDLRTEEEKRAEADAIKAAAIAKQREALTGGKKIEKAAVEVAPSIDVVATKPAETANAEPSPSPASQETAKPAAVETKPETAAPAVISAKKVREIIDLYKKVLATGQITDAEFKDFVAKNQAISNGEVRVSQITEAAGIQLEGMLLQRSAPADVGNARTETKPAVVKHAIVKIREPKIVTTDGADPHDEETGLATNPKTMTNSQHTQLDELLRSIPTSVWPVSERTKFVNEQKAGNYKGFSAFQARMLINELEKLAGEKGLTGTANVSAAGVV